MIKKSYLVLGAIPAIIAILVIIPLVTKPNIPFSAANPNDVLELEYTIHQLRKVSHGVTERIGSEKTEILTLKPDGQTIYRITTEGYAQPEKSGNIDEEKNNKIRALIKETGIMEIPSDAFPLKDGISEYQRSSLKITLNNEVKKIFWPEQNTTNTFIPPIITQIEYELGSIIEDFRE